MNILFLFHSPLLPYLGGVERVSHVLGNALTDSGHKVKYLSLCEEYNVENQGDSSALYYIDIKEGVADKKFKDFLYLHRVEVIINQSWEKTTYEFLKRNKPEGIKMVSVMHNQPFQTYGKERIIKKAVHPTSLRGHILKYTGILLPSFYRKTRLKFERELMNQFLSISDKIIVLSDQYIGRIRRLMPEATITIFKAINNPNTFTFNSQSSLNLRDRENILLYVGRLSDPQKNIKGLVDVWKDFHMRHQDWKCLIAGDGEHRKYFEDYARKLNVKNIEFLGNCKDVASLYKRSKMVCVTSLYESWCMVLTEAMAYGCVPVIYESYEAAREIIDDGNTGLLIDPWNKEKMVEALHSLACDDDYRIRLASAAPDSIKKFDAAPTAEKWIKILETL